MRVRKAISDAVNRVVRNAASKMPVIGESFDNEAINAVEDKARAKREHERKLNKLADSKLESKDVPEKRHAVTLEDAAEGFKDAMESSHEKVDRAREAEDKAHEDHADDLRPGFSQGGRWQEELAVPDALEKDRQQRETDQARQSIYDDMYADGYIKEHDTSKQSESDTQKLRASLVSAGMGYDQADAIARPRDVEVLPDHEWKRREMIRGAGQDEESFVGPVDTNQAALYIDDGTQYEENLTSLYMTGDQYRKYVEAGLGGRDTEDIDPDRVYNKLNENKAYGFTYYRPDDMTEAIMKAESIPAAYSSFWSSVGNARPQNDKVTVNGKEVDLGDFYDKGQDYFDNVVSPAFGNDSTWHDAASIDAGRADLPEGAQPMKANGYRMRAEDGTVYEWPDATGYRFVELPQYSDEPISVVLSNGVSITFDDQADFVENFQPMQGYSPAREGEQPAMYVEVPDLDMGDGSSLSLIDAYDLSNKRYEADWGPLGVFKPRSEVEQFWDDSREGGFFDKFDFSDFVPNMIDIAASSAPYFFFPTSVPLGLSNAAMAAHGLDSNFIDTEDGTVSKVADKVTPDVYASNVASSLAMPFTEIGFGRIGAGGVRAPLRALENKYGRRAWMPAAEWVMGTAGEGLEEIAANPVEELKSSGLKNLYANNRTDEDGNEMVDSTGHVIKEEGTPIGERFGNFLADAPNAFLGGAFLGGIAGIPEGASVIPKTRNISSINKKLKESGAGVLRPYRPRDAWAPMDDETRAYYDE